MIQIECVFCGIKYSVFPSRTKTSKCCSRKCLWKWNGLRSKGKTSKIKMKCKNCKQVILVALYRLGASPNFYCSQRCFYSDRVKNRIRKNCVVCKKTYRVIPFRSRKTKCCSKKCLYKYQKDNGNPNWRGGLSGERQCLYSNKKWKEVSQFVFKRDGAKCRLCKLYQNNDRKSTFHIHHIISFINKKTRFDKKNLVLLCKKCHWFVHSSKNINKVFIN